MTTKQLSETELINRTRLDLFSGPGTTRLVATIAERLRNRSCKQRIIAIGRSANGKPFQVTAPPADFAEAVVEVDSRPPVQWTAARHDAIDSEVVGAEICQAPWRW